MKILVTGAAGFIGFHLSRALIAQGHEVVGLDNLNDYYDVNLKKARLAILGESPLFKHVNISLEHDQPMSELFRAERFTHVVNLAAQAGVRYSIENPKSYIDSNVVGFLNILEGCRHNGVEHLVYASSSSVYGMNTRMPLSPHEGVDHPMSLYAATKKANEMMAHSYSSLYALPTTGLRFFTVYGPWGRPDMALFLFTKNILEDKPINVFNYGKMRRDFTYIDDIVEGVVRVVKKTAAPNPDWDGDKPDPCSSTVPFRVYNIGNNQVVELSRYIEVIEEVVGKKAIYNYLPMQPGDVPATEADVSDLVRDVDFKPNTTIEVGIRNFIDWYRDYYGK
ncbi:MAG: NAD-dependent epimerase [Pseudodesulfovibrio sp.]|uniref:NAD-dependent epimerase/dehydratase n=1 Tax=Pseudodesulfovibrio aespoeensis (strain ATCC 700646 / DSM 10631 / Aspo-2) TaxID=643562 RepID=E6VSZ1_PSEA9|nr:MULTISPECIES: NAD-dependent epimerase [Pseudodesulfovibrio]MBU4243384.1 NAD-dependent epimerase [Pseudomonadota bacterium]ADU64333.1 NAD-dependent epimerase/dehydratase [Pseudodesulfovibrio aespoeensis Aspo-2]MBU4378123.1 NAD-dependent epimerase [Pseudomonadota bacterium]MBU4475186.1 NAD-dependent epimerase [Pseudomonadota bacterium]MBU4517683.1 NAD-dependent epimerase [Pseudomonadota bacterium]